MTLGRTNGHLSNRSARSWPPYHLVEQSIEEKARQKLDKLERLYHIGQDNIWDGKAVLGELIAKHGAPNIEGERKQSVLKILSILLWGELAAWAISADLAERIDDIEAKMAATSQAHDEARHFYVLRDYCLALGEPIPHLGGIARRLLLKILDTHSLLHKLVGMQLLVESNALALFRGLVEAQVEPVLSELLPYYETDEARHVGLGVMYLPKLLRDVSTSEAAGLMLFQLQCVGLLISGGMTIHEDLAIIGMNPRKQAAHTVKLQNDIIKEIFRATKGGNSAAAPFAGGLMNPAKGFGPNLLDFVHPVDGPATGWHRSALQAWKESARLADRWLA